MSNNKLKSFVKLDEQNRAISSSVVYRQNKPKVGRWR